MGLRKQSDDGPEKGVLTPMKRSKADQETGTLEKLGSFFKGQSFCYEFVF